jgi:hypothetical protein
LELSLLGYLAFMFAQGVVKFILGRCKMVSLKYIKNVEDLCKMISLKYIKSVEDL